MSNTIQHRREYLFLYDVSYGNPNGDPNDENKPRIDEESGRNLVTDVRLKRTIRDYLYNFKGIEIFVREIEASPGKIQDAKARAKDFGANPENILNQCIDVRLFGGTIPVQKKENSITFTGPVQFNMGQSLHRVKLEFIKGTGAFASEQGKGQKTFREEWILPYSLIAFHGVANENAAMFTRLTDDDLELLKEAMWEGTKNLITRSKNEHMPRLLVEIHYKPGVNTHIGELHRYVSVASDKQDVEIRTTDDYKLTIKPLLEVIENNKDIVDRVVYRIDRNLKTDVPFALNGIPVGQI